MTETAAEPRWLTAEEQTTWRAYLRATRLLEAAADVQMQRDSGMPVSHYVVLAMLSEAPGHALRMTDLAAVTQSSRSRLSHAVARLEERGLVERRSAPNDRRGQLATLTDAGWDLVSAVAPGHVERVRSAMFDRLTPAEVAELGRICEKVAAGLEAELVAAGDDRQRPVRGC